MSTDSNSPNPLPPEPNVKGGASPLRRLGWPARPATKVIAVIAILALGAGMGSLASRHWHGAPNAPYAALPPVAITALVDGSTAEIKGQVAEIFGNKFVVQDVSGRALVETGPQGEGASLVTKDESVSIQGRFERGFVHAQFIVHGDGKIVTLQPPHGPPHHGPRGWAHDSPAGSSLSLPAAPAAG